MTFNLDLAVRTLARIEVARLDNRWDQAHWGYINLDEDAPKGEDGDVLIDEKTNLPVGVGSCQTAFCYAGWALTLEGVNMRWTPTGTLGRYVAYETVEHDDVAMGACEHLGIPYSRFMESDDFHGEERPTDDGIADPRWDENEGMPVLFRTTNTLDDLYAGTLAWIEDAAWTEERLREVVQSEVEKMLAESAKRPQ